jgi:transcriptional regulator with XRE-family HTH domain
MTPPTRYRLRILGARLWRARREAGLTQEEVATALGRDQAAVSRLEHGARALRLHELQQLAELYGVAPESLWGRPSEEEQEIERTLAADPGLEHPLLPSIRRGRM